MSIPRESIRKMIHAVLKKIKPFTQEHTSPRDYDVRKAVSKKFTTPTWNEATLFIDGTHIAIESAKFMKEPQWESISFYSYKLKTTAVVIIVSNYFI